MDHYTKQGLHWCVKCLEETQAEERLQDEILRAIRFLNLPERLKSCTFDTFRPVNKAAKKNFELCKEFAANWEKYGGLILLGGVGTGKTHLSVAICQSLAKKGKYCCYTTVSRIVRRIKNTWKGKQSKEWGDIESEESVISGYASQPLLVIDEVGVQYCSDTERIVISEIVNDRYNSLKPTIIIGNVTFSEVQEAIGKRAVDRICDNGQVLVFDWESHRKRKLVNL